MSHRLLLFFLAAFQAVITVAQPPAGYYTPAGNLAGKALQKALHDIITNHSVIPYNDLMTCFRKTDVKNDSLVWDMYSDKPGGTAPYVFYYGKGQECGNYDSEADCYNREHSFPKSWFNDASPMISDLFHIYPTDGYVNNRRANYPFGEIKNATWVSKNGSKVGTSSWSGYTGIVFEPVDEYKGDFARTFFYMATRYFGEDSGWPGSDMVTGAEPKAWARDMLLAWHRRDTVSTKEINRNNEVFKLQKNRNPFIDNPVFAEKIWGILSGIYTQKNPEIHPVIFPNPAHEYLNLNSDNKTMDIKIFNLTGVLMYHSKTDQGEARIGISNFLPGFYLIRIEGVESTFNGSFIKQ
jgi:endonuclease I